MYFKWHLLSLWLRSFFYPFQGYSWKPRNCKISPNQPHHWHCWLGSDSVASKSEWSLLGLGWLQKSVWQLTATDFFQVAPDISWHFQTVPRTMRTSLLWHVMGPELLLSQSFYGGGWAGWKCSIKALRDESKKNHSIQTLTGASTIS